MSLILIQGPPNFCTRKSSSFKDHQLVYLGKTDHRFMSTQGRPKMSCPQGGQYVFLTYKMCFFAMIFKPLEILKIVDLLSVCIHHFVLTYFNNTITKPSTMPQHPSQPAAQPRRNKTAPKATSQTRTTCPAPGCPSTFSRPSDLHRHQKSIHGPKTPCAVLGCNYATGRPDKMKEHVGKMHCVAGEL